MAINLIHVLKCSKAFACEHLKLNACKIPESMIQ